MSDVGWFTPEDAREVLSVVRRIRASGLLNGQPPGGGATITPGYHYVSNVSGVEIPAYGCMQMTGTTEVGGQNYIEVDQPADADGAAGAFLFNGPSAIAIGEKGIGLAGPVVRALGDGTAVAAGDKWAPVASQFTITKSAGGLFTAIGGDDVATDVLKVQTAGLGGGRLYRFELTGAWSSGVANADIKEMDGTAVESSTVEDPEGIFSALASTDTGLCFSQGGSYFVVQANCPA